MLIQHIKTHSQPDEPCNFYQSNSPHHTIASSWHKNGLVEEHLIFAIPMLSFLITVQSCDDDDDVVAGYAGSQITSWTTLESCNGVIQATVSLFFSLPAVQNSLTFLLLTLTVENSFKIFEIYFVILIENNLFIFTSGKYLNSERFRPDVLIGLIRQEEWWNLQQSFILYVPTIL